MRLATAADEILPLRDPRVQQNEAYLVVIVLARVITRLGFAARRSITGVIEDLYASDLAYLQRLYEKFNASDDDRAGARVPKSNGRQEQTAAEDYRRGGSMKAYPVKSLYEEMAFIATTFIGPTRELMQLDHRERRRWCREISAINRALDGAPANPFEVGGRRR